MAQTVIGIFDNASEAQNAAQQLISNGFSRDSIDISSQSQSATGYDANRRNSDNNRDSDNNDFGDKIGNFFGSLFGNEHDDSKKYSTVANRGTVVTVHARSMQEAERAADILDQYGSVDVDDRHRQYTGSTGSAGSTAGFADASSRADTDFTDRGVTDSDKAIPIIEENLQVGKRTVETGGVRLRSRIIERPVEEHLRLREEHVNVERVPVNRPVSSADMAGFKESTIEMTESAEVPIVNKEARIVEEVRLNKEVTERDEVVRDTVRRTDVDVDNLASNDKRRGADKDNDSFLNNNRLDRDNDGSLDADDLNRPANR